MQGITYAPQTTKNRSLAEILTIESATGYDTIYLGSIESGIKLGYITSDKTSAIHFVPEVEMETPFLARTSYTACLFDVFTMIANDLDLAIEFTILVNHKTNKKTESK